MEILVCVKRVPDSAENEISVGRGGRTPTRGWVRGRLYWMRPMSEAYPT